MDVAVIDEDKCIGCALCIKACPVDAIVGAHAFMHTVIEPDCIGCELCLAPCPVDCIAMAAPRVPRTVHDLARVARERHARRKLRLSSRTRQHAAAIHARREELKAAIRQKPGQAPAAGRERDE